MGGELRFATPKPIRDLRIPKLTFLLPKNQSPNPRLQCLIPLQRLSDSRFPGNNHPEGFRGATVE